MLIGVSSYLMGKYDVGHTVFIPVNGIGGLRIIVPICRIGKQPENSATANIPDSPPSQQRACPCFHFIDLKASGIRAR